MNTKKNLLSVIAATMLLAGGLYEHLSEGDAPFSIGQPELAPAMEHAADLDGWICLDRKIFFPKTNTRLGTEDDERLVALSALLTAYEIR